MDNPSGRTSCSRDPGRCARRNRAWRAEVRQTSREPVGSPRHRRGALPRRGEAFTLPPSHESSRQQAERRGEHAGLEEQITAKSLAALRLVEGLLTENISEDQKGIVQANPLYARVRDRLEEFLLAGGGGFLEARQADARARRLLSRTIVAAVRKFTGVDDRYRAARPGGLPAIRPQSAPLPLSRSWSVRIPSSPRTGSRRDRKSRLIAANMKLPLSQAIFYMENELLPDLERKLAESPGSATLQEEIRRVRERVEDYKKLRFFPRSTPVLLEKGYYTEGMTGYTADGEMLVPMPLAGVVPQRDEPGPRSWSWCAWTSCAASRARA